MLVPGYQAAGERRGVAGDYEEKRGGEVRQGLAEWRRAGEGRDYGEGREGWIEEVEEERDI